MQQRRRFLGQAACGLGAMALADLLSAEGHGAEVDAPVDPLRPKPPHFRPTAKRVIFVFMAGAPSQLDLFDPKPELQRLHGQKVPASFLDNLDDPLIKGSATVMASPRKFKRHGQCGMDFSDYLPHMAGRADDLCMIRSMHTDAANHHPAQLLMNCGTTMLGHPSAGSWVTYGLGSPARNMPGFVVLLSSSGKGVDGGASLWTNGFLPSTYRGVTIRSRGQAILHLDNPPGISQPAQRVRLDAIGDLNRLRQEQTGDREISARIAAYELAYRMQSAAPELLDFSRETAATLDLYGINDKQTNWFGSNCLLARRMVERGVRFVQLYHSTWDDHSNLNKNLKINCDMTDRPFAGLLEDLKRRGLLEETLVVWGGEFGRTPMNEVRRGNTPGKQGRDHHPFGFTMLLAGGGIRAGHGYGQTDRLGYHPIENPVHVNDLQATILHCLGMDHTKLTYRHQGRDFRLTDVDGNVLQEVLA